MIRYEAGGSDLLEVLAPLWEKLRDHHRDCSSHFTSWFAKRSFEQRHEELVGKAKDGDLRADIAYDDGTQSPVGYCVSTIDEYRVGEIDSLFLLPEYRGSGIGEELMQRHLTWLQDQETSQIQLVVAEGNERVIPFYQRFGFQPFSFAMQIPPDTPLVEGSPCSAMDQPGQPKMVFHQGSLELLPNIEPLWLALRDHHARHSTHFREQLEELSFEGEKLALMQAHKTGNVGIFVASTVSNNLMGYSICVRMKDRSGIVESLYVRPEIRDGGIGRELVRRSLVWLKKQNADPIRVRIAIGNEKARGVYERCGFRLRTYLLRWRNNS